MDCSPSGSSVHEILQARILEWVAISSSRGSSWPRDPTWVSCISRWILYHWATWETNKWTLDSQWLDNTKVIPCSYFAAQVGRGSVLLSHSGSWANGDTALCLDHGVVLVAAGGKQDWRIRLWVSASSTPKWHKSLLHTSHWPEPVRWSYSASVKL